MFSIDWRGLILPISYMLVLGGTFVTFSSVYRKRKAGKSSLAGKKARSLARVS